MKTKTRRREERKNLNPVKSLEVECRNPNTSGIPKSRNHKKKTRSRKQNDTKTRSPILKQIPLKNLRKLTDLKAKTTGKGKKKKKLPKLNPKKEKPLTLYCLNPSGGVHQRAM